MFKEYNIIVLSSIINNINFFLNQTQFQSNLSVNCKFSKFERKFGKILELAPNGRLIFGAKFDDISQFISKFIVSVAHICLLISISLCIYIVGYTYEKILLYIIIWCDETYYIYRF